MLRIHNTTSCVTKIELSKNYFNDSTLCEFRNKPNGLWYSFLAENEEEVEFHNLCLDKTNWEYFAESFAKERCEVRYKLDIDLSKLYHLSLDNLHDFNNKYVNIKTSKNPINYTEVYKDYIIDWNKLAERYSGVEVLDFYSIKYNLFHLTYMNSFNNSFRFIELLDIPSGCIWDLNAINNIERC